MAVIVTLSPWLKTHKEGFGLHRLQWIAWTLVLCFLLSAPALALEYKEAPMLQELVQAGKLPPVAERLPQEPVVVEPTEEIGRYGGTLQMAAVSASQYAPVGQSTMEYMLMMNRDFTEVIPNIAKDWAFSEDGRTFTLYLREGLKWSNGDPFNADDIMFWWEDVMLNEEITPVLPRQWVVGGKPMQVTRVDDHTIRYDFSEPYFGVLHNFTGVMFRGGQWYCFLPDEALKKYHIDYNPDADQLAKEAGYEYWWQLFSSKAQFSNSQQIHADIPGMGPWVTKQVMPDGVIFDRNPYYFKVDTAGNQLPYIDRVRATFFGENQQHLMRMVAGQVDFEAWGTGITDYPLLKRNEDQGNYDAWLGKDLWASASAYGFSQNYTGDPEMAELLRNKKFRQALSLAIVRDEVVDIVGLGNGQPWNPTVAPNASFFKEEWGLSYAEYDPERAEAMLDEIGLDKRDAEGFRLLPSGKPLTLIVELTSDMPQWPAASELVKEYWEDVGVRTVLKVQNRELLGTRGNAGEVQVYTWVVDGFSEHAFISGRGGNYLFAWTWAPMWLSWWNSNGEDGVEPPEEMKEIFAKCESLPSLPSDEAELVATEILDAFAENLWMVGTVGYVGKPMIADRRLGNINRNAHADNADTGGMRNSWLEEAFFKE